MESLLGLLEKKLPIIFSLRGIGIAGGAVLVTGSLASVYTGEYVRHLQHGGSEPKMVKISELPIYGNPEAKVKVLPEEIGPLRQTIQSVRVVVWDWLETYKETREKINDKWEIGKAHTQSTIDMIRENPSTLPKVGVIVGAGATGVLLGYRGGILKRGLYGSVLALTSASLCYPEETVNLAVNTYERARESATIDMIRENPSTLPKVGVIVGAGATGVLLGYRGGILKRGLYGSVLALTSASLCYPEETVNLAVNTYERARESGMLQRHDHPKDSHVGSSKGNQVPVSMNSEDEMIQVEDRLVPLSCRQEVEERSSSYVVGSCVYISDDQKHELYPATKVGNVSSTAVSQIICGMLNAGRSGTIYCGIDKDGVVFGLEMSRDDKDRFRLGIDQLVHGKLKPVLVHSNFEFKAIPVKQTGTMEPIPDLFVIEIHVKAARGVTYTTHDDQCFYRYGAATSILTKQEIRTLVALEEEDFFMGDIDRLLERKKRLLQK